MASYMDQCTDVMGVSSGWKGLDSLYRVRGCGGVSPCAARNRCVLWPCLHAAHTFDSHARCPHAHSQPPSQVVPGELTIVTGIPNSGKSEWIDALLCNLSEAEGWSFALCSMEKKVRAG